MSKRGRFFRLWALLLLLLTNCVTVAAAELPSICIIGFSNRAGLTNMSEEQVESFATVEDFLAEDLTNSGKLDVYDYSFDAQKGRLDEVAIQLDLGKGSPALQEVATEYAIYGYLTNVSIKRSYSGFDTLNGVALNGKGESVCVNLSAKVVECASGKILLTVTGKGESTANKVNTQYGEHTLRLGKENVSDECLQNALVKAAHELAGKIIKAV